MCELDRVGKERRRRQEWRDRERQTSTQNTTSGSSAYNDVALLKVSDENSWSDEYWKTLLKQ